MKKIINTALVLTMSLTLVPVPTYAVGTTEQEKTVKLTDTSEENISLSLGNGQTNYRESDYIYLIAEARAEYDLIKDSSNGGQATIRFQSENDETKTYTQQLNYYQIDETKNKLGISGNLERFGFGDNCPVKIVSIEIEGLEYQVINSGEGLSFSYSDLIRPEILSVEPDENNKAVYSDDTVEDQFAFYVNLAEPYSQEGWTNCQMSVTNENGDSKAYLYRVQR